MTPQPQDMGEQEASVGWCTALSIWFAAIWRFLLVVVVFVLVSMPIKALFFRGQDTQRFESGLLMALFLPVGLWIVRAIVNRDYGAYRLTLRLRHPPQAEKPDEAEKPDMGGSIGYNTENKGETDGR